MSLRNRPASSISGSSSSPTSSPRSKIGHRSVNSSSDSASFDLKARHRHNDYSCYIHVINKTGTDLELVESKHKSGHWADGSPPQYIKPDVDTLIELTDPKGPHGSEGWCIYRFHHPERSNAVTFKLKFGDPYWVRDDNYLHASTSYPDLVSVRVLKYQTSGHPFIAYAEIISKGTTRSHVRDTHDRSSEHSSDIAHPLEHGKEHLEGGLTERSPNYGTSATSLPSLSKTPIHNVLAVEFEDDQEVPDHVDKQDNEVAVIELLEDQDQDTKGDDAESEDLKATKNEVEKTTDVNVEAGDRVEEALAEVSKSDEEKDEGEKLANDTAESASAITTGTMFAGMDEMSQQDLIDESPNNRSLAAKSEVSETAISDPVLEAEQSVIPNRTPQNPETEQHEAIEPVGAEDVEVAHVAENNTVEVANEEEHDLQPLEKSSPVHQEPDEQQDTQEEIDQSETSLKATEDTESIRAKENAETETVIVNSDTHSGSEIPNMLERTSSTTTEHTAEQRSSLNDRDTLQADQQQDEFDEDDYVRVLESEFETSEHKDNKVKSDKTAAWNVFQSSHVRLGIVATVFLASYGFTMARISRGLWLGGLIRRRS